jgi:hypothetical protein
LKLADHWISRGIHFLTNSPYNHVGIIYRAKREDGTRKRNNGQRLFFFNLTAGPRFDLREDPEREGNGKVEGEMGLDFERVTAGSPRGR